MARGEGSGGRLAVDQAHRLIENFKHLFQEPAALKRLAAGPHDEFKVLAVSAFRDREDRRFMGVPKDGKNSDGAIEIDCVIPPFTGRNALGIHV